MAQAVRPGNITCTKAAKHACKFSVPGLQLPMSIKRLNLPSKMTFPVTVIEVHVREAEWVAKGAPLYTLKGADGRQGLMRAPMAGRIVEGPVPQYTSFGQVGLVLGIDTRPDVETPVSDDVQEPEPKTASRQEPELKPEPTVKPERHATPDPEPVSDPVFARTASAAADDRIVKKKPEKSKPALTDGLPSAKDPESASALRKRKQQNVRRGLRIGALLLLAY